VAPLSHTFSSCERNIHPSPGARNPRNSPPLVTPNSSGGSSHIFLSDPKQWQPGRIEFRFCFAAVHRPLIASSGSDWESSLVITIHSQTLPSSQSVSVALCATSCVRGAHVTLPSWGVDHLFSRLLPKSMYPVLSFVSLLTDLLGDNRYSLLRSPHD